LLIHPHTLSARGVFSQARVPFRVSGRGWRTVHKWESIVHSPLGAMLDIARACPMVGQLHSHTQNVNNDGTHLGLELTVFKPRV
jgi:hypothetical protein